MYRLYRCLRFQGLFVFGWGQKYGFYSYTKVDTTSAVCHQYCQSILSLLRDTVITALYEWHRRDFSLLHLSSDFEVDFCPLLRHGCFHVSHGNRCCTNNGYHQKQIPGNDNKQTKIRMHIPFKQGLNVPLVTTPILFSPVAS